MVAIGFIFYFFARAESDIMGIQIKELDEMVEAAWYSFGTMLGEGEEVKSASKSHALRWLLATWMLFCLVVTASYAGNLKAFLTTPAFTTPINTLKEVVDSGLPWGMVLYGEEEEEMMARSTDPVIKTIWNDKYVAEYSPTPKVKQEVIYSDIIWQKI